MADFTDTVATALETTMVGHYNTDAVDLVYPGGVPTYYFQRLYDTGTGDWVYYTKTSIDPAPLASETTPNYTGAISAHSIVTITAD